MHIKSRKSEESVDQNFTSAKKLVKNVAMNNELRTPQKWLMSLGLVVITIIIYWPVHNYGFINIDDQDYVSSNLRVQAGLTIDTVRWAFTESHACNWHPLTWLSHALDCQIFGLNSGVHHSINVGFHIANILMLLRLLIVSTNKWWRSFAVAALFALHPLHVESVAWIAERKDVLSTFFGLMALIAYVKYAGYQTSLKEGKQSKKRVWYSLALTLFFLGLMSKPMLVTLPCVMLLLDFWPLQRVVLPISSQNLWRLNRLGIEKLPFIFLTVGVSFITVIAQQGGGATVSWEVLPLNMRLANIPMAYMQYLIKIFWPTNMAVFYPYEPATWNAGITWLSLLVLTGITILMLCNIRARAYMAVGWLWFLGSLVPVIGLVQVGLQAIADRYTYFSAIGIFIILVWLIADWVEKHNYRGIIVKLMGFFILMTLAFLTRKQIGYWQNNFTLATHAVQVTNANYLALTQLAGSLAEIGRLEEAVVKCRQALAINPGYAEAYNTLATILARQGKIAAAREAYEEAVRCDHTFPDPQNGLAELCIQAGQFVAAEQYARGALNIAPLNLPAYYMLAKALQSQGKLDESISAYEHLIELGPNLYLAHRGRGSVLMLQGKISDSIHEFEAALKLQPNSEDSHLTLGTALLAKGEAEKAINHFVFVLKKDPTNAIANYNLGLIFDSQGKSFEAVKFYHKALAAQPAWPEALNNLAWLLATCPEAQIRDGKAALQLAERACQLTGYQEPFLIGTLAAAYAEEGRYDESIVMAEKAASLAQKIGLLEVAKHNIELKQFYQARKPYHEPAHTTNFSAHLNQ